MTIGALLAAVVLTTQSLIDNRNSVNGQDTGSNPVEAAHPCDWIPYLRTPETSRTQDPRKISPIDVMNRSLVAHRGSRFIGGQSVLVIAYDCRGPQSTRVPDPRTHRRKDASRPSEDIASSDAMRFGG